MNTLLASLRSRVAALASTAFARVRTSTTDGLEDYLSTAKSLHQLEDMQRRWDRAHRGRHTFGAH